MVANVDTKELKDLCMPIVEFIRKNFHPYTTITIKDNAIMVNEVTLGIPLQLED